MLEQHPEGDTLLPEAARVSAHQESRSYRCSCLELTGLRLHHIGGGVAPRVLLHGLGEAARQQEVVAPLLGGARGLEGFSPCPVDGQES